MPRHTSAKRISNTVKKERKKGTPQKKAVAVAISIEKQRKKKKKK